MKLSELIGYKNLINEQSVLSVQQTADQNLDAIANVINTQKLPVSKFVTELEQRRKNVEIAFDQFDTTISALKEEVQKQIDEAEKPWFEESYRLYSEEMVHETSDYILNRRPVLSGKTEMVLSSRLATYVDWRYPCLVIRPGLENFVQDLVGYDPLYLIDQTRELLAPAMARFSPDYQRRLRTYTIEESITEEMLGQLPDGQIGMCLAYNYFNYRPMEIIEKYLVEVFKKLRPGGVLAMTFNDCDRESAVKLVEQHFSCYTPGHMITNIAENIGYIPIFTFNDGGPSRWVEFRKLGKLSSLKGGQTLAKVIVKSK